MENTLIFSSDEESPFRKTLKIYHPDYLTSLFNTVYTIIDASLFPHMSEPMRWPP